MLFEEVAENMGGNFQALFGDVGLDADVEAFGAVGGGGAGYLVQEVREPEEVVPVADDPVEINPAMSLG